MKTISEYSDARISVIGGLALWMYVTDGRSTQDVDFIINIDSAPASVKQKLLALPNSPFTQHAQFFYYVTSDGKYVQIDITPGWQSPYIPASAKKLKNIPHGDVPYISPIDLIVFKMNSCGLRAEKRKKEIDANDAQTLLAQEARQSPISLTAEQQTVVESSLADVLDHSSMAEEWWREKLGLPQDFWVWSDEYNNWYHIHEDGSTEWFVEGESSAPAAAGSSSRGAKHKGRRRR